MSKLKVPMKSKVQTEGTILPLIKRKEIFWNWVILTFELPFIGGA
jgi:hypothetical protein